ncbi:hypothetical protein GPALN_003174 [Globodera pallida]|nr:hypothetical protein GPALN_003174 [Globodera pallida]
MSDNVSDEEQQQQMVEIQRRCFFCPSRGQWLLAPREDGLPKMLDCDIDSAGLEGLKEAFVNAIDPINFIIKCWIYDGDVVPFELKNYWTRERLTLQRLNGVLWLLVRCPIAREEAKWAEWEAGLRSKFMLLMTEEEQRSVYAQAQQPADQPHAVEQPAPLHDDNTKSRSRVQSNHGKDLVKKLKNELHGFEDLINALMDCHEIYDADSCTLRCRSTARFWRTTFSAVLVTFNVCLFPSASQDELMHNTNAAKDAEEISVQITLREMVAKCD